MMKQHEIFEHTYIVKEIESHTGKIEIVDELYGGSDRKFLRAKGRKGSLVLLLDNNSRLLNAITVNSKYLNEMGHLAPVVYINFWEHGLLLMEDIGDSSLESILAVNSDTLKEYKKAIDMLCFLQSSPFRKSPPVIVQKSVFDKYRLLSETRQFIEHYLNEYLHVGFVPGEKLLSDFDRLAKSIEAQPQVLMHRDFQSKNIMFFRDKYMVVDIQDNCIGPYSYDLAALLDDPYVCLDEDITQELIDYYYSRLNEFGFIVPDPEFRTRFYNDSAISRLMQAIGAYARLTLKGKGDFEKFIEPALIRLIYRVERSPYKEIKHLLNDLVAVKN